ncbi:DUF6894 family protein [Bradyrhizobium erythrophlei]
MCRFFFDRRDEQGIVTDDDGMLLSDLEAAQDEAARALGDFARGEAG